MTVVFAYANRLNCRAGAAVSRVQELPLLIYSEQRIVKSEQGTVAVCASARIYYIVGRGQP